MTKIPTQRSEPEAPLLEELTRHAEALVARQFQQMGYPFDQSVSLSGYYNWLLQTGLCNLTLINVGSPYKTGWDMLEVDEFERRAIDFLAEAFRFPPLTHWGVLTNGGTDGNMHGVYFGRKFLEDSAREMGLVGDCAKPILYVSEEAHYSVRKLGDILQIETRTIAALEQGQMDIDDFRRQINPTRPALVAIAIGGTFKGAIDDQRAIETVLNDVRPPVVYRHLDAALFGGYLPWLEDADARSILDQSAMHFDSIAVSGHKFLAMNEPVGIFICRKEILDRLHTYSVPYLNGVIPTINCSRSGFDALKLYWRIATTTPEGFRQEAEHVLRMSQLLVEKLTQHGIPNWRNPYSNTVCMRRPAESVVHKYAMACSECRFWGELAHVVVMQFFNESLIDQLVEDIVAG
ncbi:MAG: pyridoxal-dependent decarboxylase [Planctomycetia bacterium]|nr:pyridoxal-dependent decarboxylase [Planctomycetia bacterium]